MNKETLLCVLNYNGMSKNKVLDKFMKSYLDNTDINKVQLLLIDNGSTDESIKYLQELDIKMGNDVDIIYKDHNTGVIEGRNTGFHYFTVKDEYDYLMFLDNDQYVRYGWYDNHIKLMKDYDLIGVEAWYLNDVFVPVKKLTNTTDSFSYVGCGGMCVKKKVVSEIGFFDNAFSPAYFEDPDYSFRAYEKGFKIGWNYKALIDHEGHQTLGGIPDKNTIFKNSYNKFYKKWKGSKRFYLTQKSL